MSKITISTLGLFFIIASLIINYYFKKQLYNLSITLIFYLQSYSSPIVDYFFILFSLIIDPIFIVALIVIGFAVMKNKKQATIIVVITLLNTYIFMLLKTILIAPRPFWTHENIRNIGYYCPKDYGSPSGHTQFSVFFLFTIINHHFNKNKNKKVTFIGLAIISLVMLSRMYLGGHTLDQLFLGFVLAWSISLIYGYGGGKQMLQMVLFKNSQKKHILKVFLLICIFWMSSTFMFYYNYNHGEQHAKQSQKWLINYNKKCNKSLNQDDLNHTMLFANTVLPTLILGYFIAIQILTKNNHKFHNYLNGYWTIKNQKKPLVLIKVIFVILQILCFTIPFIIFYPLSKIIHFDQHTVKLIHSNIGCILSPLSVLYIPTLFIKYIGIQFHNKKQKIQFD